MKEIKLAENLRRARRAKKISQCQLADMLGVDQRTVSAWEHRVAEPNLETIAKLCDIFDETFDSMISDRTKTP